MTIHYDMPMAEYLADPRIGSSRHRLMLSSAADYKAAQFQPFEDTKATVLGTAIHTAILEPMELENRYALQPEDWGPRNSNPGAKLWREFKDEHSDKIVLGFEEASLLLRIKEAARNHRALQDILSHARGVEVTGFRDIFKARTDIEGAAMLWDVKTTSKGMDDESLAKTIFHMGYHFQAAHHNHVFKADRRELERYGWIFVSTDTPAIHIRCVLASPELLAAGVKDFEYARGKVEEYSNLGQWPGYDDNYIGVVGLPAYAERFYE